MSYDHLDDELLAALNEYERQRKSRGGTENEPVTAKLLLQVAVGELACIGMSGQMLKRSARGEQVTVREIMAAKIWDCGFGLHLAKAGLVESQGFHHYLETIPEIPDALKGNDPKMPYLTLVDNRLLTQDSARLIGLRVHMGKTYIMDVLDGHSAFPKKNVFWVQHGHLESAGYRSARKCLQDQPEGVVLASLDVGLFVYLLHREVLDVEQVVFPETLLRRSPAILSYEIGVMKKSVKFPLEHIDSDNIGGWVLPCRIA